MTRSIIIRKIMTLQGGYIVVILKTWKPLTIRNNMIHELPLSEDVIFGVKQIVEQ